MTIAVNRKVRAVSRRDRQSGSFIPPGAAGGARPRRRFPLKDSLSERTLDKGLLSETGSLATFSKSAFADSLPREIPSGATFRRESTPRESSFPANRFRAVENWGEKIAAPVSNHPRSGDGAERDLSKFHFHFFFFYSELDSCFSWTNTKDLSFFSFFYIVIVAGTGRGWRAEKAVGPGKSLFLNEFCHWNKSVLWEFLCRGIYPSSARPRLMKHVWRTFHSATENSLPCRASAGKFAPPPTPRDERGSGNWIDPSELPFACRECFNKNFIISFIFISLHLHISPILLSQTSGRHV